jgi:hypothetical protein
MPEPVAVCRNRGFVFRIVCQYTERVPCQRKKCFSIRALFVSDQVDDVVITIEQAFCLVLIDILKRRIVPLESTRGSPLDALLQFGGQIGDEDSGIEEIENTPAQFNEAKDSDHAEGREQAKVQNANRKSQGLDGEQLDGYRAQERDNPQIKIASLFLN